MEKLYRRLSFTALLLWFCSSMAIAQDRSVSGKIIDETGQPLPGVNVLVKGTSSGTTSDVEGAYTIGGVNDNSILVFSFIGYHPREVAVGSRTVIDVDMTLDVTSLEEIVVIGYGEKKKALITGANLHQDGSMLQALNTTTPIEALQGISPGVSITRNSGQPGAGTRVRIRGIGTIGNGSDDNAMPLYIVDGVPVGNIDYLSASDIESIDVLKDAASAAIYGSRGANGVILVTTRKGKPGAKAQINYNAYYGIQNIYKKPAALNAQEYMYIMDEARMNDGLARFDWENLLKSNGWLETQQPGLGVQYGEDIWAMLQNGWKGTDWVDEMVQKDAPMQSHSINITGAGQDMTYAAGFSWFDQAGMIGGDIIDAGYKRLTARLNTEFKLFEIGGRKILKLGENFTYTNNTNRSVGTGSIYWNVLHDALVADPLMPVYWEGSPNEYGYGPTLEGIALGRHNPVAVTFYRHNYGWYKGNSIVGNVYAELEPIQSLKLRSSYGINSWFGHGRSYTPVYRLGHQFGNNPPDAVNQSMYQGASSTWTTTASYEKSFNQHNVQVMVGNEQIRNDIFNGEVRGNRLNTLFQDPDYAYLNNTVPPQSVADLGNYGVDWAANGGGIMSYMARLSYNFGEKYMLDYTFRRDGSSNFIGNKQYGNFQSVSAGWNFTQESFLQGLSFIEVGKLRASWGQNGNQNVGSFRYLTNVDFVGQGYFFGDNKLSAVTTAAPVNAPNRDIGWETSEQIDIGLDAAFLKSRLNLTLDWYQKTTKDWLVHAPALGTTGADAPWINGGDVQNSGFELQLGWKDQLNDFKYGVIVSGATLKNKVLKLNNAEKVFIGPSNVLSQGTSYVSRVEVGYPIGYFYGFQTAGIMQNQAEADAWVGPEGLPYFEDQRPGDVRFVDQNNDGVIDDADRVMLGNPIPDFELGLQLNVSWKGIYANMTMAGKFGQQVMRSYRSFADSFDQNYTTEVFGRWHGEGTSNTQPRLTSIAHRNQQFVSDIYMHDADFLRITNLTVGYDFKTLGSLQSFKWLTGAQVYMSVNNLYTFTKYAGMDPEAAWGGDDTPWATGIDLGLYPLPRTVMFGVNITF